MFKERFCIFQEVKTSEGIEPTSINKEANVQAARNEVEKEICDDNEKCRRPVAEENAKKLSIDPDKGLKDSISTLTDIEDFIELIDTYIDKAKNKELMKEWTRNYLKEKKIHKKPDLVSEYVDKLISLDPGGVEGKWFRSLIVTTFRKIGVHTFLKVVQKGKFKIIKIMAEETNDPEEFKKIFLANKKDNLDKRQVDKILSIINPRVAMAKTLKRNREASPHPQTAIPGLSKDESLANLTKIEDGWLPENLSEEERAGMKIVICRNLYFEKKEITKINVKQACKKLLEIREETKNINPFKGRKVVFVANNEKWPKNKDGSEGGSRFGKAATIKEIEVRGGTLDDGLIKPEDDLESIKLAKKKTLENIINCKPPMTFCFDGHGGPDALYFSGGQDPSIESSPDVKITVQEFTVALIARYDNYSQLADKMPIFIGASEYNQPSYSRPKNPYGNDFLSTTLGLGSNKKSTLGNVVESDLKQKDSNPSVYISDAKDLKDRDIFMFAQCFNSTFIRTVIDGLKKEFPAMGNVMQLSRDVAISGKAPDSMPS